MLTVFKRIAYAMLPLPEADGRRSREHTAARAEATVADVEATDWSSHVEVALAEAVRITADETARRQGADTKSSTYLVVVAALVPIVAAIQVAVWEGKAGPAPKWASLAIAEMATVYMALGGFWAFRALKVTVVECVDVEDVVAAWRRRDPRIELVRRMLTGARKTRAAIDEKLSRMLLAQDCLFRGFVALVTLLLLNAAWYFAGLITSPHPEPTAAKHQVQRTSGLAEAHDASTNHASRLKAIGKARAGSKTGIDRTDPSPDRRRPPEG